MSKEREDLLSYLKQTRENLVELAQSLTAAELAKTTDNPGWSVKDTLCHAVSSEAGLTTMAWHVAKGITMPPSNMDLHTRNQHGIDERRDCSIGDLTTELVGSRAKLIEALAVLSDEELATPTTFPPARPATVAGIFRVIGHHEEDHGAEIRKALGR
jgi:uncharacterized protein (TIGR03083 family)